MLATWGTLSWRGTVPKDSQRRALHAKRQHRDAGRNLERVVGGVHARPTARRSRAPRRDTSSGARCSRGKGDGPVLTSVTAAYLQRNLRPQVRSITVHPPGIVFQKPFTTGEPDLAGFRRPDHARSQAHVSGPDDTGRVDGAGARPAHVSEGAPDARLGEPTTRTTTISSTTCCTGARARRSGRRCAAASKNRSSSGIRRSCPTAPTSCGSSRPTRRRTRRPRALAGERDSTAFEDRPHAAGRRRRQRRGPRAAAPRSCSTSTMRIRRWRASSIRATAGCAGRPCFRETGLRIRRASATSWRSTARSARPASPSARQTR